MDKKKVWAIIGSIFILVLLFFLVKNIRDVNTIIRHAGVFGPLLAIGLFGVFALTPIPGEPLTLVCFIMFGPIVGAAVIAVGNTVGAIIEYYFGVHMRKITSTENTVKKLPFGLNKLPVDSPYFLIFARIIPGYGGKVVSVVAGIHHVPIRRYIWTAAVANFSGSFLVAFGGYQILRFFKFW